MSEFRLLNINADKHPEDLAPVVPASPAEQMKNAIARAIGVLFREERARMKGIIAALEARIARQDAEIKTMREVDSRLEGMERLIAELRTTNDGLRVTNHDLSRRWSQTENRVHEIRDTLRKDART